MSRKPAAELAMHVEDFRRRCREAGLAVTHQREIIYRTLLELKNHPSPEAIYEKVHRQLPSLSLGTVYKNIRTFMDAGLLREVSPHHGTLRLEANVEPHHHLLCTKCRAITDIAPSAITPVKTPTGLPAGYRVERYSVEFYGVCPACSQSQ